MKKQANILNILKRWGAWRSLDDSGPLSEQAPSREQRIDAALRAGAANQPPAHSGELRWRVLGAISSTNPAAHTRSASVDEWTLSGAFTWRARLAAACVAIVVIGAAGWFVLTPSTTPTFAPQSNGSLIAQNPEVAPDVSSPTTLRPVSGMSEFFRKAVSLGPTAAIASALDTPIEREADRFVGDARRIATRFAERVTAPIAALHQGSVSERPSESADDRPLQGGGA